MHNQNRSSTLEDLNADNFAGVSTSVVRISQRSQLAFSYIDSRTACSSTHNMTAISNSQAAGKGISRIIVPGLRIRTNNFSDVPFSHAKAQIMASSDWRRRGLGVSLDDGESDSPSASRKTRDSRTSIDTESPTQFAVELEPMPAGVVRYRPREDQASWDKVFSAPGPISRASSSTMSSHFVPETIMVRIKDARPMTTNINGEEIILPNSCTFDLVSTGSEDSSGSDSPFNTTAGVLRRAINPSVFRRKSSRSLLDPDVPHDIQDMLCCQRANEGATRTARHLSAADDGPRQNADSYSRRKSSDYTGDEDQSGRTHHPTSQVALGRQDDGRFQALLGRLRKIPSGDSEPENWVYDIQAKDPAIVAAKVKAVVALRENAASEASESGQDSLPAVKYTRSGWSRARPDSSHDSGYSTGSASKASTGSPPVAPITVPPLASSGGDENRPPLESATSRRLNPAAAEFRSTYDKNALQKASPRKLSRAPLSNLFPQAAQASPAVTPNELCAENEAPGTSQLRNTIAGQYQPLELNDAVSQRLYPSDGTYASVDRLTCLPTVPATGVTAGGSYSGTLELPFSQTIPSLPSIFASNMSTMSGLPLGTYSRATLVPLPVAAGPAHMTTSSGFGTFPGAILQHALPMMAPRVSGIAGSDMASFTPPILPVPVACPPPLFGADRKINRPNFPVTQKPRDHDPVKQQQYEAYLEWRKANEPGYHMRCKLRQAARVVRQNQNQQQSLDSRHNNPA
jgi:hypothetical protein